ncbi:hypothetical protein TREES_T100002842 [Tupaia chinensis]|uniref:Uncharacterized protein n=1 Tax=Tupaia chinensis TaxID=246437 RepID=L9L2C4_TUPCH|nr:hypothetical protein TREES_T100002842 [Tupaia chinensis]
MLLQMDGGSPKNLPLGNSLGPEALRPGLEPNFPEDLVGSAERAGAGGAPAVWVGLERCGFLESDPLLARSSRPGRSSGQRSGKEGRDAQTPAQDDRAAVLLIPCATWGQSYMAIPICLSGRGLSQSHSWDMAPVPSPTT